jgi:uncharacterized protein YoxC
MSIVPPEDRETDPAPPRKPLTAEEVAEVFSQRLEAIDKETRGVSKGIHDINNSIAAIKYDIESISADIGRLAKAVEKIGSRVLEVHELEKRNAGRLSGLAARMHLIDGKEEPK